MRIPNDAKQLQNIGPAVVDNSLTLNPKKSKMKQSKLVTQSCHFRLLWLLILIGHFIAIIYGLVMIGLHAYAWSNPYVMDLINFFGKGDRFFTSVVTVLLTTTLGHFLSLLNMVLSSIFNCRLVFRFFPGSFGSQQKINIISNPSKITMGTIADDQVKRLSQHDKMLKNCRSLIKIIMEDHAIDVYQMLFFVKITLHIYQGNHLSHIIADKALNRIFTMTIIINCWFFPLFRYFANNKALSTQRLICLVADQLFNLVYGMLIPLYLISFAIPTMVGISSTAIYSKVTWAVTNIKYFQQLFVASYIDWFSKLLPGVDLLLSLISTQEVLTQRQLITFNNNPNCKTNKIENIPSWANRLRRVLDMLAFTIGLIVFAIHVATSYIAHTDMIPGCLSEVRPWLSTTYSCETFEISCHQLNITGLENEIDKVLHAVQTKPVYGLIFSHCSQLQMPAYIQNFNNLYRLKLFNSTISEWQMQSALTNTHHPMLTTIQAIMLNMSEIPLGWQSSDLPKRWYNLQIVNSNLTTFPDRVTHLWSNFTLILLQNMPNLPGIPPALNQWKGMRNIRLVGNPHIKTISEELLLGNNNLDVLVFMNQSKIDHLPESTAELKLLTSINIVGTNIRISGLPMAWLHIIHQYIDMSEYLSQKKFLELQAIDSTAARIKPLNVLAGSTPLCSTLNDWADRNALPNANSIEHYPKVPFMQIGWLHFFCSSYYPNSFANSYPLAEEMQWRRVNYN